VAESAPRLRPALLAAIERLDDDSLPIAEVHRRVAAVASGLGIARPSYEQVRVLVHEHRRRGLAPTAGQVLLDVLLRTRSPYALLDVLDDAS
jgi:hypothetical protein